MEKSLSIETGLVSYDLNGKVTVEFNPTDSAFVERLYSAFEDMDKKQEAYRGQIEALEDKREVFKVTRECDAKMRKTIDELFGVPVCDPLFGGMNIYAMSDGLPAWANLMLTIMDEIDDSLKAEQKKMQPRLDKYTKRYAQKR